MRIDLTKDEINVILQQLADKMDWTNRGHDFEFRNSLEFGSNHINTIRLSPVNEETIFPLEEVADQVRFAKHIVDCGMDNQVIRLQDHAISLTRLIQGAESRNQKLTRMLSEMDGNIFGTGTTCVKRAAQFDKVSMEVFGEIVSWEFVFSMMLHLNPYFSRSSQLYSYWMQFLYE